MRRSDARDRPAFPRVIESDDAEVNYGMSLRDYFAAAAMTGLLPTLKQHSDNLASSGTDIKLEAFMAALAYRFADAMLAEREV